MGANIPNKNGNLKITKITQEIVPSNITNIPQNYLNDLENSIVRININNKNLATGFFIKRKELKYIIISNFIGSEQNLAQFKTIDISFGKMNKSFKLDINPRFIK